MLKRIVDNLALADIINGHNKLNDEKLRKHCVNIAKKLHLWQQYGWRTASKNGDPIGWRPRELNEEADKCCNIAMNIKKDHSYEHKLLKRACEAGYNLFLQSDGGSRNEKTSATGWKVTSILAEKNKVSCIARGGTFIPRGHSSLHIEVLALEELVNKVHNSISYKSEV